MNTVVKYGSTVAIVLLTMYAVNKVSFLQPIKNIVG
jgi:hypothetical protein